MEKFRGWNGGLRLICTMALCPVDLGPNTIGNRLNGFPFQKNESVITWLKPGANEKGALSLDLRHPARRFTGLTYSRYAMLAIQDPLVNSITWFVLLALIA